MTEATQETATKDPNGALPVMTSTSAESGTEVNKSDAAKNGTPRKPSSTAAGNGAAKPAKKRRKVNHACIYCRRSHMTCDLERPCTRCIKRNIGHLCHDEPREPVKKTKSNAESAGELETQPKLDVQSEQPLNTLGQHFSAQDAGLNLAPPSLPQNRIVSTAPIVQPTPVSTPHVPAMASSSQPFLGFNDWNFGGHSQQYQDMHTFHPSYMFNTSEVSNEYNLLNDFLSNSLLDDSGLASSDDLHGLYSDPSLANTMLSANNALLVQNQQQNNQMLPPSQAAVGNSISRPASEFPINKAQETYYLTAADPAGTDSPEERMNKMFRAKYDAGMLKPFNYIKGYARLNQYMEQTLRSESRLKILRQIERFRPKFRENIQKLTDLELVYVEMWFERNLMEYDRVFASMAIPACCWRRTGEIFRGNKEMAELIRVPIENLREGKLAIHEIIAEDSLVSYWEKFGAIAFDSTQKAILTTCSLKNPDREAKDLEIRCCFSFTIRRDTHNIPSLIVGNFLPIQSK